MVCESLNGALYGSLNGGSNSAANGGAHDDLNLQEKLLASAKRMLVSKMEYEEGPSHKLPYEALKQKYIVLKPSSAGVTNGHGGVKSLHNGTGETKVNGTLGQGECEKGAKLRLKATCWPTRPGIKVKSARQTIHWVIDHRISSGSAQYRSFWR